MRETMKILFILPIHKRTRTAFPLGLAYLSSYLCQKHPDIKTDYIDLNFTSWKIVEEKIKEYPIIAITGLTSMFRSICVISKHIKQVNPESTIILGGPIVTSYPDFMIKNLRDIDLFVINEGEVTLTEIVERRNIKDIAGIGYWENGVKVNPSRLLIEDLDTLPFPDYKTFKLDYYGWMQGFLKIGIMIGSRGCLFNCNFCFRNFEGTYRLRSISNILDEVQFMQKNHNIEYIEFYDELFFIDKKRIEDFCNMILKRKIRFQWMCFLRVNLADIPILRLMKKAGCRQIGYGIESGSQKILDAMNKKTIVKQNIKALKDTLDCNILTGVNLIIGYPGENPETLKETEAMLYEAKVAGAFHFIQAYPGTRLYQNVKDGFIPDEYGYFDTMEEYISDLPINFTEMPIDYIYSEKNRIESQSRQRDMKQKYLLEKDYNVFRFRFMFDFILKIIKKICGQKVEILNFPKYQNWQGGNNV